MRFPDFDPVDQFYDRSVVPLSKYVVLHFENYFYSSSFSCLAVLERKHSFIGGSPSGANKRDDGKTRTTKNEKHEKHEKRNRIDD